MPLIHFLNPLEQLGGSEMRTILLSGELRAEAEVHVWTQGRPAPAYAATLIQQIDVAAGKFPRGGTLVIVGAYFALSDWIERTAFERVIIIYNTFSTLKLAALLAQLERAGLPRAEIVYASELLRHSIEESEAAGHTPSDAERLAVPGIRRRMRGPGVVHASPLDLAAFESAWHTRRQRSGGPLVVGRMSRDTADKFHPGDPALFRLLARQGFELRLMGATTISTWTATDAGIEVLPTGAEPSGPFLASLDAFIYRTSPTRWLETFGRVVHEAMLSGLPCVCERRGGYVDLIDHGRNGFLFETEAEAVAALARLRDDGALRSAMGAAARQTLLALYSDERRSAQSAFYLQQRAATLGAWAGRFLECDKVVGAPSTG